MNYWILKSEPSTYSWQDLVRDKKTAWTGIRNYQARNNIRSMQKGDICFFYHSGDEKQIVGIATVTSHPYPDPSAEGGNWSCVDIQTEKALIKPVSLAIIKAHPVLQNIVLARNSRLSVSPLNEAEYQLALKLAQ